ncbi:MAG: sulfatase-like hydrolase/transferase [Sphaerochaetaceae bacterium]
MNMNICAKKRPNVVVFFTDQQRFDSTGVHGNPLNLTPNFDRMALEGTHFAHMYTCQPVCAPARSSLQTGQYATTTGVWKNHLALDPDATTLATCFRQAGYKTGYIGKWHLGGVKPGIFDWDQAPVPESNRGGYEYWLKVDLPEFVSDEYHTVLFDNDNRPVRLPGYRVDAYTDAAIDYINTVKDEPFFLFLSFLEPHHQNHRDDFPAPHGYDDAYVGKWMPPDLAALGGNAHGQIDGYWGMVRKLDEAFGRVRDALFSLGLQENTIVVFSSDHGCHFKTRNNEYKRSCHDSSIHIPAAISGPGFVGGGRVPNLVSLVDLTPTLLDAAGLPIPDNMQGTSYLPYLHREKDPSTWKDVVFAQISEDKVSRTIRTKRWKYAITAKDVDGFSVAGSDCYEEEFLYDLQADPFELENLNNSKAHEAVRARLRKLILIKMHEAGEKIPNIIGAVNEDEVRGQRLVFKEELDAITALY